MTKPVLPQPIVFGRRRYWRRRLIREYLAEVAKEPSPAPRPDDESLMDARELRTLLGGITDMTLWRRMRPSASPSSATPA
jgi:hypothetical protein